MLAIVVPFSGRAGKRRLGLLPAEARAALSRAMLADVIAACEPVGEVRIAEGEGQAASVAAALPAAGPVLVVNADLPCATPADVRALVETIPPDGIALVQAADGTTNALGLARPDLFRPLYGPGSAARFRALGAVVAEIPNLVEDVDTVADLERLRDRVGPSTREVLAGLGQLQGRLGLNTGTTLRVVSELREPCL